MSPVDLGRRDIEYYLNLIDVVRDGIICTDLQGRIEFINQRGLVMWGYRDREILGAFLGSLFVEEDQDRCCKSVIKETLKTGKYEGGFLFKTKDGKRFPGYLSSSCLKRDGDPQGVVFVIHDFTEQRKLQRRLMESQKLASLGKLLEGVAHEIRNPIVTLGGYTRRLQRELKPDHPGQESVRVILEDVERMEGMLKDLEEYLDFVQAHPPEFARVDLKQLVQEVIKHLSIPESIRLEEMYPREELQIYGNSNHLKELFRHLLENAMEAMPKGGFILMELVGMDDHAQIKIKDSGVGIPKAAIPNIYSPFFTTKTKGVGVGLAKAYIIVDEHAGQMDVDSELERGTTFTLTFPTDRRQRPRRYEEV